MNKNIVYLGFVSFFTDFASAMINPILPIFVVVYLKEGMDKLGIIVAVATFVSYALRLFSGYISDRFGIVKPLVVAGYTLSALSKPLIGFSVSYKDVAFLKAVERFGKALRSAAKDSMLAFYGKEKKMGRTFGFHKTLDIAGELGGSLFLFFILNLFQKSESVIREIFYFTFIPGFLGLFILIFFVEDVKKTKKIKKFKFSKEDKKVVKRLFFYFFYILFFFNESFFTMQAKEVGIGISLIPLLFVVSTFSQTLTSYLSGMAIDRFGEGKILLLAYFFGIVAQILLFLQNSFFTWIAYAFLGLFSVFSLNANRAYIAKFSKNKASVYGIFYAGVAFFGAFGAYLTGIIWENFGLKIALSFSLSGVFVIFSLFFIRVWFESFRN